MTCPDCGARMEAHQTRRTGPGEVTRRRICPDCGRRFDSIEIPLPELRDLRLRVVGAETA